MTPSDLTGWCAAALMVATFACTEERHMRPLALATNIAFIGYAMLAGLLPVLAVHLLLLPINLWRCCVLRVRSFARASAPAARARPLLRAGTTASLARVVIFGLALGCLLVACGSGSDAPAEPPRPLAPLTPLDGLQREWIFAETVATGEIRRLAGDTQLGEVELLRRHEFGPLGIAPAGRGPQADGEIFANASGTTYWVEAEAPLGDATDRRARVGGTSSLLLKQSYRKDALDATLRLLITDAVLQGIDGNGDQPLLAGCPWATAVTAPQICYQTLSAEISMSVTVLEGTADSLLEERAVYQALHSAVNLSGWGRNWTHAVSSDFDDIDPRSESGLIVKPIFRPVHFERTTSSDGLSAEYALRAALPVDVDLTLVPFQGEFTLEIWVAAEAVNRRGRESYARARLRDPLSVGGVATETTGLTPTNRPRTDGPLASPPEPPPCTPADDPHAAGELQFSAARYHVPEFRVAEPVILVTRSGGSDGTLAARLRTRDGTARAGTDYTALDRRVVFGDGDTLPRVIRLPIVNDELMQGDRSLTLELSEPMGCGTVGARAGAEVVIIDDEARVPSPPTYTVGGAVSGLQGAGLVLEEVITGRRVSPGRDGPFTFDYAYDNASPYDVRIITQPTQPAQVCSLQNSAGAIPGANVVNVFVICTPAVPNGSLDPAFGAQGKVFEPDLAPAVGVVVQPAGRIVVLAGMTLVGYDGSGARDAAFGSAGLAPVVFNNGSGDEAYGMTLQPDGKLIVVGRTRVGAYFHMAIKRFNADGSVDTGFGSGGLTTLDPYAGPDSRNHYAERAIVAGDGSIYLTGVATYVHPTRGLLTHFAAARLQANGSPARDYGGGGTTTATRPDFVDSWGKGLGLQSDGKLVIGGWSDNSRGQRYATLARFKANGTLDTDNPPTTENFGRDGSGFMLFDPLAIGGTIAVDMLIADDLPVVALSVSVPHPTLGFVTQFGLLGGASSTPIGPANDVPRALLRQADGKFILVGSASSATTVSDFAIVRYNADQSLDAGFGTAGVVQADFFGGIDGAAAVAQQADGKLVVAGLARNGVNNRLGVVRLMP